MSEGSAQPRIGFQLTRLIGGDAFDPRPLPRGVSYIGRDEDNDVVLSSGLVSGRHAKIIWTSTGLTVHDLDSHNGVFLNGKKVRSKPVSVGDRLYFADVCVRVDATTTAAAERPEEENRLDRVLGSSESGFDLAAAKNLDALVRASDLLSVTDQDIVAPSAIGICRDLTAATFAAIVLKGDDDKLQVAAVLHDDADEPAPDVNWPIVRRAIEERRVLFTEDNTQSPLVAGDLLDAPGGGAIMCAPLLEAGFGRGAVFLSRELGGDSFGQREVETLTAVAQIVSARMWAKDAAAPSLAHNDTEEGRMVEDNKSVLEAEVARLREENERLKGDVSGQDALTEDLQTLRADVENLNKALQQRSNALADKAKTLAERTKAHTELTSRFESLSERAESDAQAAHLEQSARAQHVETIEQRVKALEQAKAGLNDELEKSEATLARVDQAMREAQVEAERTKADLEAQRTAHTSALGDANAAHATLEAALAEAKTRAVTAESELDDAKGALEEAKRKGDARLDPEAVRTELKHTLAGRAAERIAATLAGNTPDRATKKEDAVVVFCALHGLDEWAPGAAAEEVAARLDSFVGAVRRLGEKLGAEVDIPAGSGHVVVFPPDENGLRAALSFSAQLLGAISDEHGGVQGGIHLGAVYRGTFGDDAGVCDMVLGAGFAVARGACEYADAGTVLVTDAVKSGLGPEAATMFILKGPHLIRGFRDPFNISQLAPRALP